MGFLLRLPCSETPSKKIFSKKLDLYKPMAYILCQSKEEVDPMTKPVEEATKTTHTRKGFQRDSQPKRLPTVLTEEEQKALLQQPNPQRCPGLRNLCLLRFMLNTGLRAAEVLNLKLRDVDWRSGQVMVREGKGKKDRTLWIGAEDRAILKKWLKFRAQLPENEFLFTTRDGKRLQDSYLRRMVKRLAKQAGIDKDVHPHMLRHTFATDLLRQTKNIRLAQKALGHAQITSTQVYTHIVDDELEEAMKTFRVGGKDK
jgi:integrase/recombinase XerD